MKLNNTAITLFLFITFSAGVGAGELVRFEKSDRQEFSPARGESHEIPIAIEKKAIVRIEIFSVDGHLIRTIESGEIEKGAHFILWDGKDDDGVLVPDEAWVPVVSATAENEMLMVDPQLNSGGETIKDIRIEYNDHHSFSYRLPAAARVSIRAGIRGGPLLNVLSDWEPHTAGRNIVYWDGLDKDDIVNLRDNKKLKIVASAFKLPRHSIVTTGNVDLDYQYYLTLKNWKPKPVNMANIQLQRNDKPLSRQYFMPLQMNKSPDVQVELLGDFRQTEKDIPEINDLVDIRVSMDEIDRQAMHGSSYEIGFFVDNVFISEEEQGYVPLTWRWKPNNLAPGKHVLTVNVSSFRGQVGVSSLEFSIPEP